MLAFVEFLCFRDVSFEDSVKADGIGIGEGLGEWEWESWVESLLF